MKAKTMAIFLAITLMLSMMAVLPAQATTEVSYDMERSTDGILPDGFTVTPGKSGATVSWVDTEIAGNATNKLKIEHTENATTTVTVEVNGTDKAAGYDSLKNIAVTMDFYLAALTSTGENDGLKMVCTYEETKTFSTGIFKDTTYDYFRTMMAYDADIARDCTATITFTGVGTVYLDDFTVDTDTYFINGDFEGLSADGVPAGMINDTYGKYVWRRSSGSFQCARLMSDAEGTYYKVAGDETRYTKLNEGVYFVESAEGNYIEAVNQGRAANFGYVTTSPVPDDLTDGVSYRFTVTSKSANSAGGVGFSSAHGLVGPNSSALSAHWTPHSTNWTDRTYTVIYDVTQTSTGSGGSIRPEIKVHAKWNAGSVFFDKFRLEPVEENVTLSIDGAEVNALENNKTVKITYEKPVFTKEEAVTYKTTAPTEKTYAAKKVAVFAALYKNDGESAQLEKIDFNPQASAALVLTTGWGDGFTENVGDFGYLPATANLEIQVPETGEYTLRIFAWDSVGGLKPFAENTYTFATATEA